MGLDILTKSLNWSNYLKRYLEGHQAYYERLLDDVSHTIDQTFIIHAFEEEAQKWVPIPIQDAPYPIYHRPHLPILSSQDCKSMIRAVHHRIFSTLIVRDIEEKAELNEVTVAMSLLAELCIMMAYRCAMFELTQRYGIPIDPETQQPMEMLIVAMGKLGGYELNVSSDIDLIMLYGAEGNTQGGKKSISHHEFYSRLTQKMMPILSEHTVDGFAFRTDLRLRPDGYTSPLAWSLDGLENYLITQGREWERYAWLKGRVIEDIKFFEHSHIETHIQQLESLRIPFVYRKYFDFDTLTSLRQLRNKISDDLSSRTVKRAPSELKDHIKLGEGGIREIEFIVQLNQLIRAGRIRNLRERGLLKAIQQQVEYQCLEKQYADVLTESYTFLRRVEHMLQYRENEQTHTIPTDTEVFTQLASVFNLSNLDFRNQLNNTCTKIHALFKDVFRMIGLIQNEVSETSLDDEYSNINSINDCLSEYFNEVDGSIVKQYLNTLFELPKIKSLSDKNLNRLDLLIPKVLEVASTTSQPTVCCANMLSLIETIAQRSAYFALLSEYPEILQRIATIMDTSPWAAQYLIKTPLLLDSLISWQSLMQEIDFDYLFKHLNEELDRCVLPNGQVDIEAQMNLMRDFQKQITFQLLIQDLEGIHHVMDLADILSELADRLLNVCIERIWPLVSKQPDTKPDFAIIAYGKLGGKELGYSSDLDLVMVFEDKEKQSIELYTKLARRLSNWCTTLTPSGRLYEIDMRLRPDGDSGLLAVSMAGFENYQQNKAWLWEHQALTRARVVAGSPLLAQRFDELRKCILMQDRSQYILRKEILAMRQKIYQSHFNRTNLFDIKHDPGGMIDIEFMTQYLVLLHSKHFPQLTDNLGNINLLEMAGKYKLIDSEKSKSVAQIYANYRSLQHKSRLLGNKESRVEYTPDLENARDTVISLWKEVFDIIGS